MIIIKSPEEIRLMAEGGKILSGIVQELKKKAAPGVTTKELDEIAKDLILRYGKPSFRGYRGYPASLCTSINEEIVHGIPSERALQEGDILSLDLGLLYKEFHTDMAITFPIGEANAEALRLIRTVKKALKRGIKKAKEGNTFEDIGNTIERYIKSQGFSVISDLCGHGIGRDIHEEPDVPNFGKRGKGIALQKGMVFCIEPMASIGSSEIEMDQNEQTFKTKDGSLSAHFEHTVALTDKGCEILTDLS